ncbi:hypothetical protein KAR91_68190 [Candidatus Pacearchaeota archaeon]|nr:hypothetical protein [Candidatus Pacearchaeota archaeon]
MENSQLKAIIMAILSPSGIGGPLNASAFKNLNDNADRILKSTGADPIPNKDVVVKKEPRVIIPGKPGGEKKSDY